MSFTGLRKALSLLFEQIPDMRQAGKVNYRLHDCLMSALAMMFFQDPSLLAFQRRMNDSMHCSNLKTLFNVGSIPKDTVLRETLDALDTNQLSPAFGIFAKQLQRGKQLESYRLLDNQYLIGIDGSQYFSSEKIHCPGCLTRKGTRSKMRYSHQILQAVMLHPHMRQVLPLAPEPVANTDGSNKQDCEINAALPSGYWQTSAVPIPSGPLSLPQMGFTQNSPLSIQ